MEFGFIMLVIVLLVYYEKYCASSLFEIKKIAQKTSDNCKIILVNNNPNEIFEDDFTDVIYLKGDNSNYEFSGWDVALKYIRRNYNSEENLSVIFANDTFCFHRKWFYLKRISFIFLFKDFIKRNRRGIGGEVNSICQSYCINDQINLGWVSTYLFILSGDIVLDEKFYLNNINSYWDKFILKVDNDNIYFKTEFDENLGLHLNKWLFPKKNEKGWYNSSNINIEKKIKKLESILNEKLLSSNIIRMNAFIYDVNNYGYFKFYKFLKNFVNKIIFFKR